MKKTEIAFILDRSGSMQPMTNAPISGFNEFLKAQQATVDDHGQPLPATFSLILFDHEYLPAYNRQDIQTVRPLTLETYLYSVIWGESHLARAAGGFRES